jgi:hypothetical protein
VVYLKTSIWFFSIFAGIFSGWFKAKMNRLEALPKAPDQRSIPAAIFGALLCLWSIERLVIGISPVGTYDTLGLMGIKPEGIWYNFDAVVAAIIMILAAAFGGYVATKGLIPFPRGNGRTASKP